MSHFVEMNLHRGKKHYVKKKVDVTKGVFPHVKKTPKKPVCLILTVSNGGDQETHMPRRNLIHDKERPLG